MRLLRQHVLWLVFAGGACDAHVPENEALRESFDKQATRQTITADNLVAEDLLAMRTWLKLRQRAIARKVRGAVGLNQSVLRWREAEQSLDRCVLKKFAEDFPRVLERFVNNPNRPPIQFCFADRTSVSAVPNAVYGEDIVALKYFFHPGDAAQPNLGMRNRHTQVYTTLSDRYLALMFGVAIAVVNDTKLGNGRQRATGGLTRGFAMVQHMAASFMHHVDLALRRGDLDEAVRLFHAKHEIVVAAETILDPDSSGAASSRVDFARPFYRKFRRGEYGIPLIDYQAALPRKWKQWRWKPQVLSKAGVLQQPAYTSYKGPTFHRPTWAKCHRYPPLKW